MASKNWTADQQNAIEARGGTLLVSAAAGSGKTAVLVERVISRLLDEDDPCTADRLLIVTFSNAAAGEMKERISARIAALVAADPFNLRLKRQQLGLSRANISTIHSFCLDLIRTHFQKLGVSPDFRVADENELSVMRADAMEEVVEQFYKKDENGGFAALVELLASGRDDQKLMHTVLKLYDFVRSHPFPNDWLAEKYAMYDEAAEVGGTVWGRAILEEAAQTLDWAAGITRSAASGFGDDEALSKAWGPAYTKDLEAFDEMRKLAGQGCWDALYDALHAFSPARLGALRGYADSEKKERLKARREEVKKAVSELAERLFCANSAEFQDDIADLRPKIRLLFDLVTAFGAALDERKRAKNAVDFADLEHLALRLLVQKTPEGVRPTEDASGLSEQFVEVLVDEYQDTNEVQDMIFRSVSGGGKNLFMVGDVKQSIYRFRQAMPEIFIRNLNAFLPYGEGFPAKITLSKNFRSRTGVTGAVNFLFSQLMSVPLGELTYDGGQRLVPGAFFGESADPDVKLLIVDTDTADDSEDAAVLEARQIAGTVRRMVSENYPVWEGGETRPCRYGDFCILLRSTKGRADVFAAELEAGGVPARADVTGSFFGSKEIAAVVSLLRVIDNPLQDVPLLAAMLSPLAPFTCDDLAALRAAYPDRPYYLAVTEAARGGDPKCADFLALLERLRRDAATMSCSALLQSVYERTGMLQIVHAMPSGALREANLYLLCEYADRYEQAGYKGLDGFVRFLDKSAQTKADFPAAAQADAAEAVRIMSIHRSKGLEFPFCFVAGLSRRFNLEDVKSDTLLHPVLGFACMRRNPETRAQFTTVPREALRLGVTQSTLSEELRILYVALTRAKEKLFMTMAMGSLDAKLQKVAMGLAGGLEIPPAALRRASGFSDWVLAAALRHPDAKDLRARAGLGEDCVLPDDTRWDIRVVPAAQAEQPAAPAQPVLPHCAPDEALIRQIAQRAGAAYPYAALTKVPSKLSVSQLAKPAQEDRAKLSLRPSFLSSKGLTAAQRGTALHKFMQFCSFERACKDPAAELARLAEKRFMTKEEAESVPVSGLRAFFAGPLAAEILRCPMVHREFRFVLELSPAALGAQAPETPETARDRVTVQGVADCILEYPGALVIIDFKTDRIFDPGVLRERYAPQLALYRQAAETSFGKPVDRLALYSFALGREIELPAEA